MQGTNSLDLLSSFDSTGIRPRILKFFNGNDHKFEVLNVALP